jgi:hypothetical protein
MAIDLIVPFSEESMERFSAGLMADMNAREQAFQDRAQHVFDAILNYSYESELVCTKDSETGKLILKKPGAKELDDAVLKCLDHRSMGYLIELISKNRESANQAAKAMRRHAENNAIKADVFTWLDSNRSNYPAKSDADTGKSRAAAAIVKQQPITQRTALKYVDEWEAETPEEREERRAIQSAGTL